MIRASKSGVTSARISTVTVPSEATAIERGCRLIYLDTFTFQAPEFYYGLGYEIACQLDGFPDGGSKFILRKTLVN